MMLITPPVEPEPYSALTGPFSTSTRSTSIGLIRPRRALMSVAVLIRLPSIRTTTEVPLMPRMDTSRPQAESPEVEIPGKVARASAMLSFLVRKMVSSSATATPPGVCVNGAA